MKNYVIYTDSTSDLPLSIIESFDIKVIPLSFNIEGENYINYPDHREISISNFYKRLRQGETSVTSLINVHTFKEYFEPCLKAGNDILYMAFSSNLSGTYNASKIAAKELMDQYKGSQVICIDTKAASCGEGLLVYTAAKKKAAGLSIIELKQWIIENRDHLCHWFTVDDLNHLKRGGRINTLTATIGTALSVKPVLHVDQEGFLVPIFKVRGRKKSLQVILEQMKETCINPKEQVVFIGHGDSLEDAHYLSEIVKKQLDVKDVIISPIGPVIGSHSGPDTIALFFYGTKK